MKVIYNSIIPFSGYAYINLFGCIFTRKKTLKLSEKVINHESIHSLQGKYLLWIFFYLIYFIEWIVKIPISLFYKTKRGKLNYAYRSISFEQVAYYNENNLDYLRTANPYEWIKYVFKMYKE